MTAIAAPVRAQDGGEAARQVGALIADLASDDPDVRDRAFDRLIITGDDAVAQLEAARASSDPEIAHTAGRLVFMIRWRLSRRALDRIGPIWDDYDTLCPQDRIMRLLELTALDPVDAIPLLKRAAEIDGHPEVRAQALRIATAALLPTLNSLNAQGCDLMRAGKFEEAEDRFHRMLEIDERNETALYNLACSKSLQGLIEDGFLLLERAVGFGYDDDEHAFADPDLENLRRADGDRFRKILNGR